MTREAENEDDRYSKVVRRMWNDGLFRSLDAAPPNPQTLWFRLLTGPELTNIPGLFPAWDSGLSQALRWSRESFLEQFAKLFDKGMVEADWDAGLVWVPNAVLHNKPSNPNIVLSWRRAWRELPECELKWRAHRELRARMKELGDQWLEAFDKACAEPSQEWLRKPALLGSGDRCPNQEQEQEQDQEQEDPRHVEFEPSAETEDIPDCEHPESQTGRAAEASQARSEQPNPQRRPAADRHRAEARFVFEAWKQDTGKHRATLDNKRERRIVARLRDGFSPDELVLAIRNRRNDPHLMGETTGTVYAEIDTLLRDRAQVERLLELKERARPPTSRVRGAPRQDHGINTLSENPTLRVIGGSENG